MNETNDQTRPIQRAVQALRRGVVPASILLLNAAMLLGVLSPATGSAAGARVPRLGALLDSYLAMVAGQGWLSGSALVARHDQILLSKGYGLADREHRVPNTPDTTYSVSINSPTANLGILILEERGKLADNTLICRYLPACPAAWQPITIGMMLAGTAAIPNYDWGQTPGRTTVQALRDLQATPLDGTPGTSINYANGYQLVLDTIVEKVTGAPYAAFLQQAIAGPAGMTNTGRLAGKRRPAHFAQVYSGLTHLTGWAYDDAFPLYATTPDLYAYDRALFGGTLISARTRQRMFTPRVPIVPSDPGVSDERRAYVWKTGRILGHRVIYLIGGSTGVSTANLYFPADDVTIVINSNEDQDGLMDIAVHLAALVFGHRLAGPTAPSVDPARAVAATATGPVGSFPLALADGALWFPAQSSQGDLGRVARIDAQSNRLAAQITPAAGGKALPNGDPGAVATVGGQVWAADRAGGAIVRIDPSTNKVVARVRIGMSASFLAAGGDSLWAAASPSNPAASNDMIVHVDLRTHKVVAVIKNAGHPFLLAASPDALWYIAGDSQKIQRIDARTNKIIASVAAGSSPLSLAVGADAVWVLDSSGALLTRIDPGTNKVAATITFAGYPGSLPNCWCQNVAVGEGAVWTIANKSTLLRIDPRTNKVAGAVTLHRPIANVAAGDGSVWVASDGGDVFQIDRIDPYALP
jgi:CubicO group peptidase (beta-lactamase class C family)/streptogramin lyase